MPKSTAPAIVVPSFNTAAKVIMSATKALDKAAEKAGGKTTAVIQQWLDACAIEGIPREAKPVKAMGKAIRECQAFLDAVAQGTEVKKTITEYAQGAMRAYFHNVPFTASLKNDPAFKIPDADGNVKSGGAVKTTNRKALFATLNKALEQMRLLDEHDAAASMLDTIQEYFSEFSETEEAAI